MFDFTPLGSNTLLYSSAVLQEKKIYAPRNYTLNVDYKHNCFSCQLTIQPKHCSSLVYSDLLFDTAHTTNTYDVYAYENYPCYQRVAADAGQCALDNPHLGFSGAGCTLCSVCRKHTAYNASHNAPHTSYTYTPRFSLSVGTRGGRASRAHNILHCLNKLVLLRYYSQPQFCADLQEQLSVYKHDHTTVFTGCKSFCSDSTGVMQRELYSTEMGVYLILLAGTVLGVVGVVSCISYVVSLYRELGILNLEW